MDCSQDGVRPELQVEPCINQHRPDQMVNPLELELELHFISVGHPPLATTSKVRFLWIMRSAILWIMRSACPAIWWM
jgi:hypothetical protein